ncbi:amidase family protein [Filibacter tadaridae]|uniref:Glutamyl-tRNA(Gln) amidotransferase subunit A n=1 Tax=Filibacter tadaridae TaxID=2483811 RepID=A0A3P5WM76_9BACL|nr:amidase family protein [Filibacter tadaridae]VDC22655.1 Glutamyl-tRNA(Gln) amidotransferase subunit A [Filibacter tadaridae]
MDERLQSLQTDWLEEATIHSMQDKMENGELTSEALTLMYLDTISKRNSNTNAVLEMNPGAVQIAKGLDAERLDQGPRSLLHGIPVLLKDNMGTKDGMHTSCGSLALKDFYAEEDSYIVKKLRAAGAVILGKTNMTEWANFMSDRMTNGWSSRGGQVNNPYGLFDVGGSSSGAAAAIAANMAAVAIGTETTGSILNPSAQNSIVGIKPTVGAISRTGIIPLSYSQDTPGPMARTVEDAAITFSLLIGFDEEDPVTYEASKLDETNWRTILDSEALQGVRIGVARMIFEREASSERISLFENALERLKKAGAIIVDDINLGTMENELGYNVLLYEFKAALNAYLGKTSAKNPIRTLADVIQFNNGHAKETLKFGQVMLEKVERTSGTLTERDYVEALVRNRHLAGDIALGKALDEHNVQALVFPQDHGCSFGAAAGYPSVTVPAAYSEAGEPFGITFSGRAYSEPKLISYAYAFEQFVKARQKP